jgi:mannan endo-1,4-beta-mannosidase
VTAPSSPTGGLTITSPTSLAAATVGAPYSYTMSASGGTAPYTWSFVRDRPLTLAWLTVNEWSLSSAGVLSSILNPSAEETATLVIQVKDAAGNTATGNFYIPVTGVAITTPMKLGVVGVGASFTGGAPLATMAASGGSGNYSWSLASQSGGSNSWSVTSGGAITGNPTHVETDTLVISATDTATGQTVSNNFYVSVVGAVTAARPSYNRGTGLFVLNGELYDPSGTVFRLRGIDRAHFDSNPQPGFQKTGANSTRMFMYTVNGSIPASTYASAAQNEHIAYGEVPIIAMAQFPDGTQTTGNGSTSELNAGVGWWTANYSAFASIQKYMILNIANEWGPSNSAVWSNAYISAVAALRAAGYTCPIMIDAGGSGQDINDIVNFSGAVFNSDPQKNLIFAFHFYGLSQGYPYSTVAMLQSISGSLAALKSSVGAAYAFTEFGPGYAIGPAPTNLSPGQIVTTAEAYGLGTVAWAWDDNDQGDEESDNNWFSFTYAGGFTTQSDLTIYGQDMVLNPYLGIQTNSALPMGF